MNVHTLFDIAAAGAASAMTVGCFFWRLKEAATRIEHAGFGYAVALVGGAAIGGYAVGTANLWLSGEPGVARSIVGALAAMRVKSRKPPAANFSTASLVSSAKSSAVPQMVKAIRCGK